MWYGVDMTSWFKKIKKADASSAEDPSGLDAFSPDAAVNREDGQIHHSNRHPPVPFQVGDTVRLHYVGLAFPQIDGVVEKVGENEVIVKWQSGEKREGKEERFTMDQAQGSLDKVD